MEDSVTVHVDAEPAAVWALVSDITNTGRFSPETFEAEWLDGATGPAVGVRFRGHVKRNERGPVYWTTCRIDDCEPGRSFGFWVVGGGKEINHWQYRFDAAASGGTDVTESFRLADASFTKLYWKLAGRRRGRYNQQNMRRTLERVKAAAEGTEGADRPS